MRDAEQAAPHPYAPGLAALASASTPSPALKTAAANQQLATFAEDLKCRRLAALDAEHAAIKAADARAAKAAADLGVPIHELRLASDDADVSYAPPDPYKEAIRLLKEREARRCSPRSP